MSRGANARKAFKRVLAEHNVCHPPHFEAPEQPSSLRSTGELIKAAKESRARLQATLKAKQESILRIPSNKPFIVADIPDQHMDSPGSSLDIIFHHASLIRDTDGVYCNEVGDSIDNFIISKLAHARNEHLVTVKEAWQLVEEYHRIIGPKLLAAISGNHLSWTTKLGGVDVLERILREHGIKALYDADELFFSIEAQNGRRWQYGIRHSFRGGSQYHPVHSIVRYIHSAAFRGEDVSIGGHLHVSGHAEVQVHGKMVHAIQCGSYKNRDFDDYCREKGFLSQHPFLLPCIIHFPESGRSMFFPELEEAIPYLKYLRGKK